MSAGENGTAEAVQSTKRAAPLPLEPLDGPMRVPTWALRPGSYSALKDVAPAMQLWLAIYSRNDDHYRPCYHNVDQLAATIGRSPRTVNRHLELLEQVGLLFKLDRGRETKSQRARPPARWAVDPFRIDRWRDKLYPFQDEDELQRAHRQRLHRSEPDPDDLPKQSVLSAIAEEDGKSLGWLRMAARELNGFERASRALANRIAEDMPVKPRKRRRKKKLKRKGRTFGATRHNGVRVLGLPSTGKSGTGRKQLRSPQPRAKSEPNAR